MSFIDEHVVHEGKGKTRTTQCRHCSKIFTSRSKDRWRQHMRGCDGLPSEFRRHFSSFERQPYARQSLNPSETASEVVLEAPASPAANSEPRSPISDATSDNVIFPTVVTSTKSSSLPAENSLLRAADAASAAVAATDLLHSTSDKITEILLIYGPCNFMRSGWTGGGEITKANLLREVHNLAVEDEISLVTHESNHEGTILDWLLNAKENEIIVLCWVGRLSDSPTILHALELINNRIIVISPIEVNHGTLPSTVVGVLSGFGQLSFNLALAAAKNINTQL